MFPILETERLILREIKKEDSENIFACFSNNDVTRYYGQESFQNIEQAEQLVQFFSKNYNEKRGIRWGIERKDTKGIIGTVGFNAWCSRQSKSVNSQINCKTGKNNCSLTRVKIGFSIQFSSCFFVFKARKKA